MIQELGFLNDLLDIWIVIFQVISQQWIFSQANNGRAILFSHAMNIILGPKEDSRLITGVHTIADVYCSECGELLGWKYWKAYEESQKYKEGKIVLENRKIVEDNW